MEKAQRRKKTEAFKDEYMWWAISNESESEEFLNSWGSKETQANMSLNFYLKKQPNTTDIFWKKAQSKSFIADMDRLFTDIEYDEDARTFVYINTKEPTNIALLKDLNNMFSTNVSQDFMNEMRSYDKSKGTIYINAIVRTRIEEGNPKPASALMGLISYYTKGSTVYITYITRCWQGFLFPYFDKEYKFEEYEPVSLDALFSKVIETMKRMKKTHVEIQTISDGSSRMFNRHLNADYKNRAVTRKTAQKFPIDQVKFQICTQCEAQIALVSWEAHPQHVFCGKECAEVKWRSVSIKNGFQ